MSLRKQDSSEETGDAVSTGRQSSWLTNYASKIAIRRDYLRAEISLSEAVPALMFEHDMMQSDALRYLMSPPRLRRGLGSLISGVQ